MAYQELPAHKQDILNEIGSAWVRKEKAMLVSYGVVNWGMSRKEASDMAELTVEEMLTDAAKRKAEGLPWKMLFQPQT